MINTLNVKESVEYKMLKDAHAKSLEVFERTNKNFGDGFFTTWDKMGDNAILSAYSKIAEKFNTFEHFTLVLRQQDDSDKVISDSIENTLIDLANYCLMTVVAIKKKFMESNIKDIKNDIDEIIDDQLGEKMNKTYGNPSKDIPSFLKMQDNRDDGKIINDGKETLPRRSINQNQVF